jgi:phosphoribosylamine--glycine ligase
MDRIINEILNPTMKAMQAEGTPFVGTLFLGLMLTESGPKLIEYNVRFGDPETQVVLPLLESDLAEIFMAAAQGRLNSVDVRWKKDKTAVCVAAASGGYPGSYATGKVIHGLDQVKEAIVFHAGTGLNPEGEVVTAGGRVLNVVQLGANVKEAIDGAYREIAKLDFDGIYYRKDIARRELERYNK